MTDTPKSFLHFLPVSFFGAIMGLTSLSFSWGWAEKMWGVSPLPKEILGLLAWRNQQQKKQRRHFNLRLGKDVNAHRFLAKLNIGLVCLMKLF
jgi:hypothetical protein